MIAVTGTRVVIHISLAIFGLVASCVTLAAAENVNLNSYILAYDTPVTSSQQVKLEKLDTDLRAQFGMTTEQTAVGLLDLKTLRLAMIHPDREEYAASIAGYRGDLMFL